NQDVKRRLRKHFLCLLRGSDPAYLESIGCQTLDNCLPQILFIVNDEDLFLGYSHISLQLTVLNIRRWTKFLQGKPWNCGSLSNRFAARATGCPGSRIVQESVCWRISSHSASGILSNSVTLASALLSSSRRFG